jgi:integrase
VRAKGGGVPLLAPGEPGDHASGAATSTKQRTCRWGRNLDCLHRAGQRVLDATHGNLKAVQKLLGHSSISTTGDIYTDWDIDQLAETLQAMLDEGRT